MKIIKLFLSCLFCAFFLVHRAIAQDNVTAADSVKYSPSIHLIGKSYGDSVVLRWGPANPILWKAYNKSGYVIERFELTPGASQQSARVKLTADPVKVWTLEEWKARANPQDSVAAVAAQLLYGKSKVPLAKSTEKSKSTDINLSEALDLKYDMENRFSLALFLADNSPFIANGLGLRFVDKAIEKGKVYVYSIHALVDPKDFPADSSAIVVKTDKMEPLPEMPEIFYQEIDRLVRFNWSRIYASHFFTSYHYERSEDGGKTYERLNHRPFLQPAPSEGTADDDQIFLNDSLPVNYKIYHYRIVGVTPFGDLGKPSPPMLVMGRDKTPPEAPGMVTATNKGKNHVVLSWEKPLKEPDFAGFLVGRGESFNGPFVPLNLKLLGANATTFLDTTAITWGTNYYVVSAIDTSSNAGISIPAYVVMVDTLPPSKPLGLKGKIDTTGIVNIRWTLNPEPDLLGYLVYFANASDHTFNPITRDFIVDSTFTDSISLNNLSEEIYYRVVAFDKNRNPSPYSDILELKKPDKIPPVAAVFTGFMVSDTAVALEWAPSSSKDASGQQLWRKEAAGDWVEITRLENSVAQYVDTTVARLKTYDYALVTVDDDGNASEKSFPVHVRIYDSGIREPISNLKAEIDTDGRSILLSWQYPVGEEHHFIIYRAVNENGLQLYESLPAGNSAFKDSNLTYGSYKYMLKAVYKDGAQSPVTEAVSLEVKAK